MSWQTNLVDLPDKLAYIKNTGEFSDVTLVVGEAEEAKKFKVHRLLFAMYSEVLAALFYGPMKDGKDEINLPEDDPDSFGIMTRFIYGQPPKFTEVEDAIEVYYLVDKYMIPSLKTECVKYLLENISPDTVLDIYEMAIETGEHHLQKESWLYIARNTSKVLSSDRISETNLSVSSRIVFEPHLNISSELEIYKAICSWGKILCEEKGQPITAENVRSNTCMCLPAVRFLTLTVDEFMTGLGDLDVLSKEEQFSILKYLLRPGITGLPSICCDTAISRSPVSFKCEYTNSKRLGVKSFYSINIFPTFIEMFQAECDLYIYGVTVYLSLKSNELICPSSVHCTLSIKNSSKGTEVKTTFTKLSEHTDDGSRLITEHPLYVGKKEFCMITLEGTWNSTDPLYCCIGDCHKSICHFILLDKDIRYHFHGIYILRI